MNGIKYCGTSLLVGSLFALLWNVSVCASGERPIRVGISCDLSANHKVMAQTYLLGWKIYFDKVNASGGINGHRIQFKVLDDGFVPKRAVENTKQLIDWGADVLAGYVGVGQVRAVVDYLERSQAKVPFVFPLTSGSFIRQTVKSGLFSLRVRYEQEIRLLVKYFVREKGFDRWAIFCEDTSLGHVVKGVLTNVLGEYNLPLLFATSSVESLVDEIREKHPQVIVMACSSDLGEGMLKKAVDVFGKEIPYFCSVSEVFPCAYIRKIAKFLPPKRFFFIQVTPHPGDKNFKVVVEYLSDLKKFAPGEKPCFVSLEGYIAAKVLCDILKRADSFDMDSIAQAAENTKLDIGTGKTVKFNSIIHRCPIGVGLYCILTQKPKIGVLLWDDFSHRMYQNRIDIMDEIKKEFSENRKQEIDVHSNVVSRSVHKQVVNGEDKTVDVKIAEVKPAVSGR